MADDKFYIQVDDTAFSIGGQDVAGMGLLADDTTPDSVDEGDIGIARMTLTRIALNVIADATTNSQRLAIDASGNASTINNNASGGSAVNVQDGGNSLTVDAVDLDIRDLTSVSDSVEVLQAAHDSLNANANIQVGNVDVSGANPVPVTSGFGVTGGATTNFNTEVAVNAGATSNHDFTASGGTFLCRQISFSSSGGSKAEVINDAAGAPATAWVGFIPIGVGGKSDHPFLPPLEVLIADVLRITRTNRQGRPQDLYSTIEGVQL